MHAGRVHAYACVHAQSCPTLCNHMYCSLPGSSVRKILRAKILERVALSSARGSSHPRGWTCVSCISGIGRQFCFLPLRHLETHRKSPESCSTIKTRVRMFLIQISDIREAIAKHQCDIMSTDSGDGLGWLNAGPTIS